MKKLFLMTALGALSNLATSENIDNISSKQVISYKDKVISNSNFRENILLKNIIKNTSNSNLQIFLSTNKMQNTSIVSNIMNLNRTKIGSPKELTNIINNENIIFNNDLFENFNIENIRKESIENDTIFNMNISRAANENEIEEIQSLRSTEMAPRSTINLNVINTSATNNNVMFVDDSNIGIYGNNGHITNNGNMIVINGTGIHLENNSVLENNALISLGGEGNGITAVSSTIINNATGKMLVDKGNNFFIEDSMLENYAHLENYEGVGIGAIESYVINEGQIDILVEGTGIAIERNSVLENTGVINIKIEGSGISSIDSFVTNSNSGKITVKNGTGIYSYNSLLINDGDIKAEQGTGIFAAFSNGNNSANIEIGKGIGLDIHEYSSITNSGKINVESGEAFNAVTADIKNMSTGITEVKKGTNFLILSSTLENHAVLINDDGVGINAGDSSIENSGDIHIKNGIGAKIKDNSVLENSGKVIITMQGTGVSAENSIIENDASGQFFISIGKGFDLDKSRLINNSELEVFVGTGIEANNSIIYNYGKVNIDKGIAIDMKNSTGLENNNKIQILGEGIGIKSEDSIVLNKSLGEIVVANGKNFEIKNSYVENFGKLVNYNGIVVDSDNSHFINYSDGNISVTNGIGINAKNESIIENEGFIKILDNATGIDSDDSVIYNNGEMNILNGVGINAKNNSYIDNNKGITITNEGIGIVSDTSFIINGASGEIDIAKGSNFQVNNSFVENYALLRNANGTGIDANNSSFENYGQIDVINGTNIIANDKSIIENSGVLNILNEGVGISAFDSFIFNKNTGNININKGTNIRLNDSILHNNGDLKNDNGDAIVASSSYIENYGNFDIKNGTGAVIDTNSSIINYGTLLTTQSGIKATNSEVYNNGVIDSADYGILSINGKRQINTGEIISKTGVEIVSGDKEFSSHFYNSGKIFGTGYSIKFDSADSVLELGNGSKITGKIDGTDGDNTLIVSGNIELEKVENFNKLVAMGNTFLSGTVDLNPTTKTTYYSNAFSQSKNISELVNETSLGDLTLTGTINIGVNYDGITKETSNTGKILVSSLILQNASIVLQNAGSTSNGIIKESNLDNYKDQISIKGIIISNKQQAVNPDFKFQVSDEMEEETGWARETISRLENGLTYLDEVYTKTSKESGITGNIKKNSVPRNRVDLDNTDRFLSMSNKFLNMEAKDMQVNERRQSIDYVATKGNSKFESSNSLNYDYDVDSDGISGTTLQRFTDNLYGGFTLAYVKNDVDYSNNDSEKIDSFNINTFGRYNLGKWSLDTHLAYGYNQHESKIDWLTVGVKTGSYKSHVLNTGMRIGYNYDLGSNGLVLRPNIGVDYVKVSENTIRTDDLSNIEATRGDAVLGKAGLEIGNTQGKLRWNLEVGYEKNFSDTLHKSRNMKNSYQMEKLSYDDDTFSAGINLDFKITEDFSLKSGYEYKKNDNFDNHQLRMGVSYRFNETK